MKSFFLPRWNAVLPSIYKKAGPERRKGKSEVGKILED